MTTRLTRTAKTARTPVITLMCPACRCLRKCRPVGTAVVAKRRREVLECTFESCGLQWLPARTHLAAVPTAA